MPRIQTVHTPAELKNLAINGALDFWQERVGNTTTVNTATGQDFYASDMVKIVSNGPTTKNYSVVRSTDVPTFQESGMVAPYSLLYTQITGIPSLAAADFLFPWQYRMEGSDLAKIRGKVVTVGFWVKASVIGAYNFNVRNSTVNRSFTTTFNVNSPNTWEFKSITFQMDTAGTWVTDNNLSAYFQIGHIAGSTYQTSNLNTWETGNFFHASSAVNWMATSNATLRISQFSIAEGSLGFGATGFQRAGKNIQQELSMCQRYYEKSYSLEVLPGAVVDEGIYNFQMNQGTTVQSILPIKFIVSKRTIPSLTFYSRSGASGVWRNYSGGADVAVAGQVGGQHSWAINTSAFPAGVNIGGHFIIDARL